MKYVAQIFFKLFFYHSDFAKILADFEENRTSYLTPSLEARLFVSSVDRLTIEMSSAEMCRREL